MRDIHDRWTPAISAYFIIAFLIGGAVWAFLNYAADDDKARLAGLPTRPARC
jgi:hypothetical protein